MKCRLFVWIALSLIIRLVVVLIGVVWILKGLDRAATLAGLR